jgi:hypothetical protein
MLKRITALTVFGCLLFFIGTQAQDVMKIRLKGLYSGTFDQILDQINREHGVRFSFDRNLLDKRMLEDYPDNLPLEEFLEYWCALFDLRFKIVGNGVIEIVSDEAHPGKKRKKDRVPRWTGKRGLSLQPN